MATVELLLSSSPLKFSSCQVAAMSSSPGFPSPGALIRRRPQFKSGGGAAPIPTLAPFSSTAATHALNELLSANPSAAAEDPFADTLAAPRSQRKPRAVKEMIDGQKPAVKRPRKSRLKEVDCDGKTTLAPAEKPARKPRDKKDTTESQPKISKGRVTKVPTGSRGEKSDIKKKSSEVSSHFASAAVNSVYPFDTSKISGNALLLQEAVKRRRSWTPPKAATDIVEEPIILAESDRNISSLSSVTDENHNDIADIVGKFRYENGEAIISAEQVIDQTGTKKRKIIGPASTNKTALQPQVKKIKPAKKKPRTITEIATSVYAADSGGDNTDLSPIPLLQYFPRDDKSTDEKVAENVDGFKVPAKSRSTSPVKRGSKGSKAKKGSAQAPLLLSPQSAMKQVEKQNFVFGTSSQLARESSPTLLRDLEQAMRASNQTEDSTFLDISKNLSLSSPTLATPRGTETYVAKRNLWLAASKGTEGTSTYVEIVDMTESPKALPTITTSAPGNDGHHVAPDVILVPEDHERLDLDANAPISINKDREDTLKSSKFGPIETVIRSELLSCPAKGIEAKRPFSRAMSSSSKPSAESCPNSTQTSVTLKPDYGSYPTSRLAKEIASYRFKPVKGRDQMISLLERCWEGRQKVAATTAGNAQESRASNSENHQPLVLRQTPKKERKKASSIPEEIYDSDSPLTTSSPRRRTKVQTPPLSFNASVPDKPDESLILSPTSQQLLLHRHITRAIMSAPRSTDPTNPSWHEKILLYDPIVLEDITAWLNAGALESVGWNGVVNPKEVKRWCMEKSVCCLWRENLRGGARSRY